MKKELMPNHTLIFRKLFPYKSHKKPSSHIATLGIGGNIGDTIRRFDRLFWYLQKDRDIEVLQTSPILKNPPFGYTNQDDFYNAIMVISTTKTPKELLEYILRVEKKFSRKRPFKDAPRTLDIDMIFYDDIILNTKKLTLPHPQYSSRVSVLIPLSYIKRYKR
jgi:2-amino-4-hydroxy-6-hydroxymethyldihydropteridine diphosphokinase